MKFSLDYALYEQCRARIVLLCFHLISMESKDIDCFAPWLAYK